MQSLYQRIALDWKKTDPPTTSYLSRFQPTSNKPAAPPLSARNTCQLQMLMRCSFNDNTGDGSAPTPVSSKNWQESPRNLPTTYAPRSPHPTPFLNHVPLYNTQHSPSPTPGPQRSLACIKPGNYENAAHPTIPTRRKT